MKTFRIPSFLMGNEFVLCRPKKRPIVTRNGTFMPQKYRDWQNLVINHLLLNDIPKFPEQFGLIVLFVGSLRCDPGNAVEALLDTFVKSALAKDDSSKYNLGNCYFLKTPFIPCKNNPTKSKKTLSQEEKLNNYYIEITVCKKQEFEKIQETIEAIIQTHE